jgi:ribosomal protein L24
MTAWGVERMEDRWITDWEPSRRWPHYTRSNAGEVLPTPASPLGQQFCWENGICLGWRDGYVRQGSYSLDEFDPVRPECNGFFGAYFYINLSNVRMQGVRSPAVTVEQLDLAFFGDHPDVPPYTEHPDDVRDDLVPAIGEHLAWVMTATEWPEIDDERDATIALRAGKAGEIIIAMPSSNRIVVEGVNLRWRHKKPTQQNPKGERVQTESSIHASNVKRVDTAKASKPKKKAQAAKKTGAKG